MPLQETRETEKTKLPVRLKFTSGYYSKGRGMSKWYEIKTVEIKHWLVEVEDDHTEDDAEEVVVDAAFSDSDDITVEVEGQVSDSDLETMRRHTEKSRVLDL